LKGTIDTNIRHEAIPIPSGPCPFDQEMLVLFERGFKLITESGDLPSGYGVTLDEGVFDEEEEIAIGFNKKGYSIVLPNQIWKPRTELWAQGLYAMTAISALSN
jgi:hypothetical protein